MQCEQASKASGDICNETYERKFRKLNVLKFTLVKEINKSSNYRNY